jgi:Gpi18-like mannosyltransferase
MKDYRYYAKEINDMENGGCLRLAFLTGLIFAVIVIAIFLAGQGK